MPTYVFVNLETEEVEEHKMRIAEYDKFKEDNPHLVRYIEEPPLFSYSGTGDMAGKKTDNTWKEVLHKIAEQNPRSPLAEEVLRKDHRRIKIDQVIQKHAQKQAERSKKT